MDVRDDQGDLGRWDQDVRFVLGQVDIVVDCFKQVSEILIESEVIRRSVL